MNGPSQPINIALRLPAMAEAHPDDRAVICQKGRGPRGRLTYAHWTFRQLNEECDRLAHGLEHIGIVRGTRTVLMVRPSLEFFALTFALFKIGAVIVMVDPGMGRKNLGQCLSEAEPEAFIGIPLAHAARIIFGWGSKTITILVTAGPKLFWGGYRIEHLRKNETRPYPMTHTEADETAAILFTSGSTGVPKGAVYTHGNFEAQVRCLRDEFGIRPGEIDLATFPLFALFGPALGTTTVIPEMNASQPARADPRKLIRAIEDLGVTRMFGSPVLIDNLSRYGEANGIRLTSLRRVLTAGAPVRADILERFTKIVTSEAEIDTPYGATEALPVARIESREILDRTRKETALGGGICVGRPLPGVKVEIIRITDDPIAQWRDDLRAPSGEIGEIAVRGPIVTREYHARPDLTRLAKIAAADGEGFYHRMGDLGRFDQQGRLWFCGRKNHRVATGAGVLYTIPCEAVFNQHPRVLRTALVGTGPRESRTPVLCVELEKKRGERDAEKIERELLELGAAHAHTRRIRTILFHKKFPVDIRHNAKINREQLAAWAERRIK